LRLVEENLHRPPPSSTNLPNLLNLR